MAIGKKYGGRRKGTPNKSKQALLERIQSFVKDIGGPDDWHPIDVLVFNAAEPKIIENRLIELTSKDDRTIEEEDEIEKLIDRVQTLDPKLSQDAAKEVMKYIAPQLKAIEHSADNEEGAVFQVVFKESKE